MRSLKHTTVLFVTSRTGPTLSRVERRWLPVMRALVAEQATVLLVAAPNGPLVAPARQAGVTIAPYRVDRFNVWITRNRLRAYLKRYEPAIAFASGYHADIPLRLAARDLPVTVATSTYCGGWPYRGLGVLTTWGRQRLERRTRSRVDAFVVDNAVLAETLTADGVPLHKVHVVPPGVDVGDVSRASAVVLDLPGERPLIGYAGALERSRGLGTLAAAAPLIKERHPQVRVIVSGEGPARLGLLPASLDGRIELLGRAESAPALLSALDVCVFPTSESGIPTSLLEAAALGRPIVASDTPGMREVFAEGSEIVLVPQGNAEALAEAVSDLLDDPGRAAALGAAARSRVLDDYAEPDLVRRWVTLLRSLSA